MGSVRVNEMKDKEIINIKTGERLGYPADIEVDLETGQLTGIVVSGGYKVLGLFGKENDLLIKWEDIKTVGDDLIIIEKA